MGLHGHASPKPSYLLGSPSEAYLLCVSCCNGASSMYLFENQLGMFVKSRKWIDEIYQKMTKEQRDALPCNSGDGSVKMVNKYVDRDGCERVW